MFSVPTFAQDISKPTYRESPFGEPKSLSGKQILVKLHPINEGYLLSNEFKLILAVVSNELITMDVKISTETELKSFLSKHCESHSIPGSPSYKDFQDKYFRIVYHRLTKNDTEALNLIPGERIKFPTCLKDPTYYPRANYKFSQGHRPDYSYPFTIYNFLKNAAIVDNQADIQEDLRGIKNALGSTFNYALEQEDISYDLDKIREVIKSSFEEDSERSLTVRNSNAVTQYVNALSEQNKITITDKRKRSGEWGYKFDKSQSYSILIPTVLSYTLNDEPNFKEIAALKKSKVLDEGQANFAIEIYNQANSKQSKEQFVPVRLPNRLFVIRVGKYSDDGNDYQISPITGSGCNGLIEPQNLQGLDLANILDALQRSISLRLRFGELRKANVKILDEGFAGIYHVTLANAGRRGIEVNYLDGGINPSVETHGTTVFRHAIGQPKSGAGFSAIYNQLNIEPIEMLGNIGAPHIKEAQANITERSIINISMGTEEGTELTNLFTENPLGLFVVPSGNYNQDITKENKKSKAKWITAEKVQTNKSRLIVVAGLNSDGTTLHINSNRSSEYVDIAVPSACVSSDEIISMPDNIAGVPEERQKIIRELPVKKVPKTGTSFAAPQVTFAAWLLSAHLALHLLLDCKL